MELGYVSKVHAATQAGKGYDLIPVGQPVKRGDEVMASNGWAPIPDKYIGQKVDETWRPIRRRMRWDCWHLREAHDKHCPVCIVFSRSITTPW